MDLSPKKLPPHSPEQRSLVCGKFIQGEAAMNLNSSQGSILIVADLHIGFEGKASKNTTNSLLSQRVLDELSELVNRVSPDILLICGDVKDDVMAPSGTISSILWRSFNELLTICENIWVIRGNHDGKLERYLPSKIRMFPGTDALIQTNSGVVGLCHGHAAFTSRLTSVDTLVLGHSHPSIHLWDRFSKYILRTWIRASTSSFKLSIDQKCCLSSTKQSSYPPTKEIIVLPAFNQYFGGFPINEGGFVPGFIAERLIHPDLAKLYLLDGVFLGSVSICTNNSLQE